MKYIFLVLSIILGSCSVQQKVKTRVIVLTDSIQKPYAFLNELKIVSSDKLIAKKTNIAIQRLSENVQLKTTIPEERLALKKKFLKECNVVGISECKSVPEGYKIITNTNYLLNIEYTYNGYRSTTNWYKYACFDLKTGEQLTYDKMFANPDKMLKKYNESYQSVFTGYLQHNNQETDEEREEYQSYKEHLKTRKPFQLTDLNTIEFIYTQTKKIDRIRFHYQGGGGNYRQLYPNDYIEFTIEELKSYLHDSFKERIELTK